MLERIHGEKVAAGHGLDARAGREPRPRLLPRLHPAGHSCRRLPRRPAPRERAPDRGRPPRPARLRPPRAARRGDAHAPSRCCCSAIAHNRTEDVAALLLSLSLTTLESDEPSFVHELRRKLPRYHWRPLAGIRTGEALADLQRICLRYGIRLPTSFALVGQDALPGGLDRAHARPRARPDRADRGGVARADGHGGRGAPGAEPALQLPVHPARRGLAPAPAGGPGRGPPRERHAQGGRRPDRARGRRADAALRGEPHRGRDDRGRSADLLRAHGAGRPHGLARRVHPLRACLRSTSSGASSAPRATCRGAGIAPISTNAGSTQSSSSPLATAASAAVAPFRGIRTNRRT